MTPGILGIPELRSAVAPGPADEHVHRRLQAAAQTALRRFAAPLLTAAAVVVDDGDGLQSCNCQAPQPCDPWLPNQPSLQTFGQQKIEL